MPLASLLAGLSEVQVLDHDRPAAALAGQPDQRGDGRAQPPVALRSRQSRQHHRDRHRRPGRVPVRGHHPPGQMPVVQVDRQHRGLAQVRQRGGRHRTGAPGRVEVPALPCRIIGDVVADRAGCGLRGDIIAPVSEGNRARQPVPAVRPVRQVSQRSGQFSSSQPWSGCQRIVSFPSALSFSPSAVKNSRDASHRSRHPVPVIAASARRPRVRSSALPPRTTDTLPAASRRSAAARRACSTCSRTALPCRSAAVAYPRTRPARPPAGTASRTLIVLIRACRPRLSARRFRMASCHWSSLARVIAPAHRDDDSAVSARLRRARDPAWPPASSRPCAHRTARSRPASDPRCLPTARSTISSCPDTRSRVRTRAPAGAAATNGAATRRSDELTPHRPVRSDSLPDTHYKPAI